MITTANPWKVRAEEIQEDLGRFVARNNELADALEQLNVELETARLRITELEREANRIPGLLAGNRDARLLVETVIRLLGQRLGNVELQKRLAEKAKEAGDLKKQLEELSKGSSPSDARPGSGEGDDHPLTPQN